MNISALRRIKAGSYVMCGKTLRKVQRVTRYPPKRNGRYEAIYVQFRILRQSWTGQSYTIYTRTDLYPRKWRLLEKQP